MSLLLIFTAGQQLQQTFYVSQLVTIMNFYKLLFFKQKITAKDLTHR